MPNRVTVMEMVEVKARPEVVWDFTQDFSRRREWDANIVGAEVLSETPMRRVRVRGRGKFQCVLEYKLFERPRRTSLAMVEIEGTRLITGGGGSWAYEATATGGTRWTQTNTLDLSAGGFMALLKFFAEAQLRKATRESMAKAVRLIEARPRP